MALNGLICADVPLSNYSPTHHSDLVPSIYFNNFVLNNEIHNYNTRLIESGLTYLWSKNIFWPKMYSI